MRNRKDIRTTRRDEDVPRRKTPQNRPRAVSECQRRYSLGMHNRPASGSGVINVTYNAVTEAISLPHNSTPEEIKDLIDAHSEMALASVECDVEAASDWPHGICLVTMPEGATIYRLSDSLVRRSGGYEPEFRVDLCCS